MPNRDYHNTRREYDFKGLSRIQLNPSPFNQFTQWMDFAVSESVRDATAMSLATVDTSGQPHSRIVLLKEADDKGFVFYTNYDSAKGQQINQNAKAALLFFWVVLDRQVRIEGTVEKISLEDSQKYFATRPRDSQLTAFSSSQSQVVENRLALEESFFVNAAILQDQAIPCPSHWGGYRVVPNYFEFWQGRPNRFHDRFSYQLKPTSQKNPHTQNNQAWLINRMAP